MNSLREELQAHQDATDTSDSEMLQIICDFIESERWEPDSFEDDLISYVVNQLQRLPGDIG